MNVLPNSKDNTGVLKRRVRLIMLLDASEAAGLAPIKILWLHGFAYFSNVLAPVWDLPALDGAVLKRQGGPFYPALQHDLDRLVGIGLAKISDIDHIVDESNRWRLEGSFCLNREFADPILETLSNFKEERRLREFVLELGYALAALSDDDLNRAVSEDATYSDPLTAVDNVIDFDSWRSKNYSANAAQEFDRVIPGGYALSGEKLHLYVRHLQRRIHGGQ